MGEKHQWNNYILKKKSTKVSKIPCKIFQLTTVEHSLKKMQAPMSLELFASISDEIRIVKQEYCSTSITLDSNDWDSHA